MLSQILEAEKKNKEKHIPGYNFCGPGTKVVTRLYRGDKGINELDEACKRHDVDYMINYDDPKALIASDKRLREVAKKVKGPAAFVVDKVFLAVNLLEKWGLMSTKTFANKFKFLSRQGQRELGQALFEIFWSDENINVKQEKLRRLINSGKEQIS